MTAADPQRDGELVTATRALLARPWRTAEADPDVLALVRRHADALEHRVSSSLLIFPDCAHGAQSRTMLYSTLEALKVSMANYDSGSER